MPEVRTITPEDAGKLLGVSRSTIQRLIKTGKIRVVTERNPLLQRPRRLLLNRDDVESLLNFEIAA